MGLTVADLPIYSPFRIKDVNSGHYIYSIMNVELPGDIPPDIAVLPVLGVMIDKKHNYMEIEMNLI